jgi:hypothetical protein
MYSLIELKKDLSNLLVIPSKEFEENYRLDVSGVTVIKNQGKFSANYISWADVLLLVKRKYPDILCDLDRPTEDQDFWIDPMGKLILRPYIFNSNGMRSLNIYFPVMKGNNSLSLNEADSMLINKNIQRSFVKIIAIRLGLGLSLWTNEDLPDESDEKTTINLEIERKNNYIEKINEYELNLGKKKTSYEDLVKLSLEDLTVIGKKLALEVNGK